MEEIAALLEREEPARWVLAGDSITHGALHTIGWRDYTELFSERVRWELHRHRDMVIKTGISGWTIDDLAADLEWNVLQFSPDCVSLMFGMNDCTRGPGNICAFVSTYRDVIDEIRERTGALILLHTPNPVLPFVGEPRASNLPRYREAVLEIARETGAPCVDHFERWNSHETEGTLHHWLADGFHPNEYGHRALARSIFEALGIQDSASWTCQLPIPSLPAPA